MFQKILRWAGIALLLVITIVPVTGAFKKKAAPVETAESIALRKANTVVKCTPETNKNCWTLTAASLEQIKKKQDGLSRKNNQ
jgi:hypothetical protein